MARSSTLLILLLVSYLPTITASPIASELHPLRKRSSSPRNIGIGFAIAISVVVFASFIFYLGVQRSRTGTWFCWRERLPSFYPASPNEDVQVIDTDALKNRIGSPIQMHSSALPELSPVEAQPRFTELSPMEAKSKFLELSATENLVFEVGHSSPRRPFSVVSTASKSFYSSRKSSIATAYRKRAYPTSERPPKVNSWFDRKSWFCRSAMEVEDEEKKVRGKCVAEDSSESTLEPPATGMVVGRKEGEGHGTMDWSGMEWLTKVYNERKSRRLSDMRSLYIPGSDER